MKHLSKATDAQRRELIAAAHDAAIQWAKRHDISELSHSGWFNVYDALEQAIEEELYKARGKPGDLRYQAYPL